MDSSSYRFSDEMPASMKAAHRVIPLILQAASSVKSVVDLGGGNGGWLKVFKEYGAQEVHLIDCAEARAELQIEDAEFEPVNLSCELPKPGRFDLAMCLECAEHLPPAQSLPIVQWLTQSADVVVFSAGFPGQAGKGHINLQLPDHWHSLFQKCGFTQRDVMRSRMLHDQDIPWWYKQNMFIYAKKDVQLKVAETPFLPADFYICHRSILNNLEKPGLKQALLRIFPALKSSLGRFVGK